MKKILLKTIESKISKIIIVIASGALLLKQNGILAKM